MSADHEVEPIPGLPQELPPGEHILWQGRPGWRGLARHAFLVRWVAAYFGLLALLRGGGAVVDGQGFGGALFAGGVVLALGAACLAILALLALLNARATIYTITTRRVVMRFGVALPMTFNLPFKRLAAAELRAREDGQGDICLQLLPPDRIAWLHLWPHARPLRYARAEPALRAIPEVARVAELLGGAVRAWSTAEGASLQAPAPAGGAAETAGAAEAERPAAQLSIGPALATQAGR